MADDAALRALTEKVASLDEAGRDAVKALLRIGLQADCQVTSQGQGRDQLRDAGPRRPRRSSPPPVPWRTAATDRASGNLRLAGPGGIPAVALIASALNALTTRTGPTRPRCF